MERFLFRWHPFTIDTARDYSDEPTTRVAFVLHDTGEGILLTVTEHGFENLPPDRHASSFEANDGGWTHQTKLIEKYLTRSFTDG